MSYNDLRPQTKDALDAAIRGYELTVLTRICITEAVCDAIEGFCRDGCEWLADEQRNTVRPECYNIEYLFRSFRRR